LEISSRLNPTIIFSVNIQHRTPICPIFDPSHQPRNDLRHINIFKRYIPSFKNFSAFDSEGK